MTRRRASLWFAGFLMAGWAVLGLALGQATAPATSGTAPSTRPARTAAQMGVRNLMSHDPSTIVKCKDEYYMFYTGRGVPSAHSRDLVTWARGPQMIPGPPPWAAENVPNNRSGMDFWAPDCIKVGDKYLLFYSVSSFGVNTSAIGVATNPTLDPGDPAFKWTEGGLVVKSVGPTDAGPGDDFNTIDPAVCLDAQGRLWLTFGSFWSGIKMIELNPATGRRIAPDSKMYSLAHYSSIEASYIYHHDKYYYLFVNWGMCCRGARSTYNIRMGRSPAITGPYLDKEGKDMLAGGGSLVLESDSGFIGPGHAGIIPVGDKYWFSFHYETSPAGGRGSPLAIRPLTWSGDAWPVIELGQPAPTGEEQERGETR